MTSCPCCSNSMLQYVSDTQAFWFCQDCWQFWPELSVGEYRQLAVSVAIELSISKRAQLLMSLLPRLNYQG